MLNEALRLIRVYHDLSQSELSLELGISNSYLSELEAGKKTPTLEVLSKYSQTFDIPVSALLFFSERMGNPKATDGLRRVVGSKVLALLKWVEEKESRGTKKEGSRHEATKWL